jgi:death-on-curing protein
MIFVTLEQVIRYHDNVIAEIGGLAGIRDKALLESSVETPKSTMFGMFLYETVYDMAAAYLYHIIQNHPFLDGNKRTGAGIALIFLKGNKVQLMLRQDLYEELVLRVAQGECEKEEIAEFFRKSSVS